MRELIENILPHDQVIDGYEVEYDFPSRGPRRVALNGRRIVTAAGNTDLILLAVTAMDEPEPKEIS